jgi:hypothetical protein
MRPYLEKTLHKKGLVEWLKVWALSSNPSTAEIKYPVCMYGLVIMKSLTCRSTIYQQKSNLKHHKDNKQKLACLGNESVFSHFS